MALILLCLVAPLSLGWLGMSNGSSDEREAAQAAPTTLPDEALPPDHAPLAQIHDLLARRAVAGDSAAAMRLYLELERCRLVRIQKRMQQPAEAPISSEAAARSADAQRARSCFNTEICAGSTLSQEGDWIRWLVIAAEAGDPAARWKFAEGQFLSSGALLALQYTPMYLEHALQWMQHSAQSGHRTAVLQLALAYLQDDEGAQSPLAQLVAQDREHGAGLLFAYALATAPGAAEVDLGYLNRLLPSTRLSAAEAAAGAAAGRSYYERHLRDAGAAAGLAQAAQLPAVRPEDLARVAPHCLQAERP